MAVYSIYQTYIEGATGLPLSGASVEIRNESDNSLATLYSTRTGTSKANPFTSASSGYAFAYLGRGSYKITVTNDGFSATFRHVKIEPPIEFNQLTVYANLAAINAAIDTPTIGMLVATATQGNATYIGGAWKKSTDETTAIT
jgi:hypothetical protein